MIVNGTGHRSFQKDRKTGLWVSKLAYTNNQGHFVSGNSRALYNRLIDLCSAWLRDNPQVTTVIQGGAIGFDLALGRAALLEGREMHFYVPFKGHGQDWKTFYKEEHNNLIEDADYVYAPDVPFSVGALLKRNEDMVDASDAVVALHDGTPGGTSACIKYAESKGQDVTNLWSRWEAHR